MWYIPEKWQYAYNQWNVSPIYYIDWVLGYLGVNPDCYPSWDEKMEFRDRHKAFFDVIFEADENDPNFNIKTFCDNALSEEGQFYGEFLEVV